MDDFQLLWQSWTWSQTWDNLWLPHNEHAIPLGRLGIWALVQIAGSSSTLPLAATCQGPLAVLVGMGLVYVFVRRELDQPFPALVAMSIFGVTLVYQQAVYWFSASLVILALDTLLLALLAAQSWRLTGRTYYLVLTVIASALAPAWFAAGILAGPICALYLLSHLRRATEDSRYLVRRILAAAAPGLGSVLFLGVCLPLAARHLVHLEPHAERPAFAVIDLGTGAVYTGRAMVDNLLLGALGLSGGFACPPLLVPVCLVVLGAAAWWWGRLAQPQLMILGLSLIGGSYWLTYTARAAWPYDGSAQFAPLWSPGWSRYHILPQLGLALFIAAGTPYRTVVRTSGDLSLCQVRCLALLLLGIVLLQVPRALSTYRQTQDNNTQQAQLRAIAEIDRLCRQHHISAAAAQEALPKLDVPASYEQFNGWVLLRGSDDPRPMSAAEIRRLLQGSE
jgi:hypothetical protein